MTDIHISEDEQVEALKRWWKENGKAVVAGVVLGIAIVASVVYWRDYKHERAENASTTYNEFSVAVQNNKEELLKATLQKLQSDFQSTPYAALAALTMAKRSADAGNVAEAETYLSWALKNAAHDSIAHLARIRLARVLIQQNKTDEALALIDAIKEPAFDLEYAELRGDIFHKQGKTDQAREAYTQALNDAGLQGQRRQFLEMKRDDLLTANDVASKTALPATTDTEKK
jgi:predicted negative regulator of RcsB-dependent stress response